MSDPRGPHQVLWTGGWDSTFRVADLLLRHGRHVQPWYIVDPQRRTTGRELAAMDAVRARLTRLDPTTASRLRPSIVLAAADLPLDEAAAAAFGSLRTRVDVPAQFEWIAMLVRSGSVERFEVGIDDREQTPMLTGLSFTRAPAAEPDDWWQLAPDAPPDATAVFGRLALPVLELSKAQMEQAARAAGFAEVLELTWFCRWPTVLGNACGQCVPCRGTRMGGLGRRLPPDNALRRALHRWRWDWVRRRDSAHIRVRAAVTAATGRR